MSPDFCYRIDLVAAGAASDVQPLSDYALASRLSYFLWSSMPDEELLARAAAGDLHKPEVLAAQARRMLKDDRDPRRWPTEFGGNWLDFRRFEELNTVDRERFPSFNNELRAGDVRGADPLPARRVPREPLGARFPVRQPHVREPGAGEALRHAGRSTGDAATNGCASTTPSEYGRGGLLPMAAFLTKNAPGLRTSPVKRGYWVVKRVLGEQIPPPPAVVPELPRDEAKTGPAAARGAGAASRGPELRRLPRALRFARPGVRRLRPDRRAAREGPGRPPGRRAARRSPAAAKGSGFDGLRKYIREHRQDDFVDNLSRKLLAYALGRSLMLSDELTDRARCARSSRRTTTASTP